MEHIKCSDRIACHFVRDSLRLHGVLGSLQLNWERRHLVRFQESETWMNKNYADNICRYRDENGLALTLRTENSVEKLEDVWNVLQKDARILNSTGTVGNQRRGFRPISRDRVDVVNAYARGSILSCTCNGYQQRFREYGSHSLRALLVLKFESIWRAFYFALFAWNAIALF